MPTLPMRLTPANSDSPHQITSPGGYEFWSFFAHDFSRDIHVSASLFDGMTFDPKYSRRYKRYRYRPTKISPPLPSHFPGASASVFCPQERPDRFTAVFSPDAFRSDTEGNPSV